MKKIINSYSKFVSNHAVLVLILSLVFTSLMVIGYANLENKSMDYSDMLPEDYDVIKSFKLISQDFGSTQSGMIVIMIDDSYANSNEARFICDPEIVSYSKTLEDYLTGIEGITDVSGIGNEVYSYYGRIPNSLQEVREVCKSPLNSGIVSEDESMEVIKLTFEEDVDSEEITKTVSQIINNLEKPAGISVSIAGDVFAEEVIMEEISPSMQKTSTFAMVAIIVILFFLFRNGKFVILPLMTIIFGVLWTMGFLGLIGSGMSTMTSGAISMIMGIGIDFGIQILSRFKYERKDKDKKTAMEETLKGTLFPIITTALACLIGFKAMSLGELTMMSEMGNIMSYGVVFCMVAALTIVPSLLLIFTKNRT